MTALWIGAGILGWFAVAVPVGVLVGSLIRNAESRRVDPGRAGRREVEHGGKQLVERVRDRSGPDRT